MNDQAFIGAAMGAAFVATLIGSSPYGLLVAATSGILVAIVAGGFAALTIGIERKLGAAI